MLRKTQTDFGTWVAAICDDCKVEGKAVPTTEMQWRSWGNNDAIATAGFVEVIVGHKAKSLCKQCHAKMHEAMALEAKAQVAR